jgi:flagellar biosynthesis protein FlhG
MMETDRGQKRPVTVEENVSRIIAVASGKGGVGKTVIAASLGLGLSMLKKRVVLVDADFGGPNLHKVIGLEHPERTHRDYVHRDVRNLDDIVVDHPQFDNFRAILGDADSLDIPNMSLIQRMKIIRHLMDIDADFVILDLGAGSAYSIIDFFLAADHGIVVVTPDPLSLLDGFGFVKKALFRKLTQTFKVHPVVLAVVEAHERMNMHRAPSVIEHLFENVSNLDPEAGRKMEKCLDEFHPLLLVNAVSESGDTAKGLSVQAAVDKLLSVDMAYLGSIRKDDTVSRSIEKQIPFIALDSQSPASRDMADMIGKKIVGNGHFQGWLSSRSLRSGLKEWEKTRTVDVMCSIQCPFWNVCDFKKGGYPCIVRKL